VTKIGFNATTAGKTSATHPRQKKNRKTPRPNPNFPYHTISSRYRSPSFATTNFGKFQSKTSKTTVTWSDSILSDVVDENFAIQHHQNWCR
jgi:hypothetical protein